MCLSLLPPCLSGSIVLTGGGRNLALSSLLQVSVLQILKFCHKFYKNLKASWYLWIRETGENLSFHWKGNSFSRENYENVICDELQRLRKYTPSRKANSKKTSSVFLCLTLLKAASEIRVEEIQEFWALVADITKGNLAFLHQRCPYTWVGLQLV